MSNKYDDIINLPRPESKYPRMPRANRAAQFSPFAALTGHEEAIRETAYLVDEPKKFSTKKYRIITSAFQSIFF